MNPEAVITLVVQGGAVGLLAFVLWFLFMRLIPRERHAQMNAMSALQLQCAASLQSLGETQRRSLAEVVAHHSETVKIMVDAFENDRERTREEWKVDRDILDRNTRLTERLLKGDR